MSRRSRSHWRTTPETHRPYRTALYVFLRFLEESDTSTFVVCPNLSSALLLLPDHGRMPLGEIIEDYPDDTPYPSCLVLGRTQRGRPVHVVCAHVPEEDRSIIITVYEPDPDRWIEFRRRIAL
ncbi:MAG: DUF4258 domain-containing protein [Anaerolineae bacterium]